MIRSMEAQLLNGQLCPTSPKNTLRKMQEPGVAFLEMTFREERKETFCWCLFLWWWWYWSDLTIWGPLTHPPFTPNHVTRPMPKLLECGLSVMMFTRKILFSTLSIWNGSIKLRTITVLYWFQTRKEKVLCARGKWVEGGNLLILSSSISVWASSVSGDGA